MSVKLQHTVALICISVITDKEFLMYYLMIRASFLYVAMFFLGPHS